MKKCDADSLSQAILTIVAENKLDIGRCVAQCYDGDEWIFYMYAKENSRHCSTRYIHTLLCTAS